MHVQNGVDQAIFQPESEAEVSNTLCQNEISHYWGVNMVAVYILLAIKYTLCDRRYTLGRTIISSFRLHNFREKGICVR